MTRKIISSVMVTGVAFALLGCGGSSDTISSAGPVAAEVETGTAFYIDSAVSGVNYKCGSKEGITGADGEFTFEVGGSCTFYLGDIKLRDIASDLLVNGENVYETDAKIARILQSLDSDGNPDNGITIEAATVQAMADEGITALPTTEAEMDEMLAVIAANGGTEVSEEDAAAHMLTTLLGDKTFYVVDEANDGSKQVTELTFNEDLTSIKAISPEMTENWGIKIEGTRLTFNGDTDGSYTIITTDPANDYIMFTDYFSNGSLDGMGHRLYRDKADAESYFDSLKNPDLEALIVGKTVYQKCGKTVDSMTFQANGEILMVENGVEMTTGYRIDGNVIYTIEDDGQEDAHTFAGATADYIKFRETEGDITTFYFTAEDAQAGAASDCGGDDEGPFQFTTDYLIGKTLYFVQFNDFGHEEQSGWNAAKIIFNANGAMVWNEIETLDSGAYNTTYSVDGNGLLSMFADVEGSMQLTYMSQTEDYFQVCDDNDCETYLFFDEEKAIAFRDNNNK